jgi:hypothetical protein
MLKGPEAFKWFVVILAGLIAGGTTYLISNNVISAFWGFAIFTVLFIHRTSSNDCCGGHDEL